MRARILLGGLGLLLVFYLLPPLSVAVPIERFHIAMGTVVRFALYVDEDRADSLLALATREIDRIEATMSRYRPTSEVSQLNREAVADRYRTSRELRKILERCLFWSHRTGGAYDATVGPLTALWDFSKAVNPPDSASVDSARALVGFNLLRIEPNGIGFEQPGMHLDLGGSAKGYAIDRAVELLRAAGVKAGLVEAGGDIRFWGEKPDGRNWQFAVQHPRERQRFLIAEDLGLQALATSGDYEQVFEFEDRRYHHLLDPKTGYPADRAISASVWTGSALDADILATAMFVLGPEVGIELIESTEGAEAAIYFAEADSFRYRSSSGLAGRLTEQLGPVR